MKKECPGLDIREQAVELAHRFPLLTTSLTLMSHTFPWIERYALVRFPLLGLSFTLYIPVRIKRNTMAGTSRKKAVELAHRFPLLALSLTLMSQNFPWIERYALVKFPLLGPSFTLYIPVRIKMNTVAGTSRKKAVDLSHRFPLLALSLILMSQNFPWIERYALVRFPLLGLSFTLYIPVRIKRNTVAGHQGRRLLNSLTGSLY